MIFHGKALPLADWPIADCLAWQAAIAKGGLLDPSGPASHLSPTYSADLERRYGRLLGFIAWRSELVLTAPASANLTPAQLDAYVTDLVSAVGSVTVYNSVHKAMRVAEYIAPKRDWSWLRNLSQRLARKQRPLDKRARLVDSARLFALGERLMTEAETAAEMTPIESARRYRDGLMIALLALCPLRLSNFSGLALGESLVAIDGGWSIAIDRRESKRRRPIEMQLPEALLPYLVHYLERYRPCFTDAESGRSLWLSSRGGPLSYNHVEFIICERTKAAFGRSVSPHLFRHCAATTVASRDGSRMGVAVALLGHRHPRLLDKHYNHAGMVSAVSGYQAILAAHHDHETKDPS